MGIFDGSNFGDEINKIAIESPGSSPILGNGMLVSADPDIIEPFVNGYGYLAFTKLAGFFTSQMKHAYRAYHERNLKSLDLFQDFDLETASVSHGFHGNSFDVASNIKRDINRLTTTHNEFWNLPVSSLDEAWVTGMRDPETGMAHYHGLVNGENAVKYKPSFHTGSAISWITDPAGQDLLRAAMMVNLFPLSVKLSHFNFSSGSHDTTEVSMQYAGIYHESKYINAIASKLNELSVANSQMSNEWGSFIYDAVANGSEGTDLAYLFDETWTGASDADGSENAGILSGVSFQNPNGVNPNDNTQPDDAAPSGANLDL